MFSACAHMCYLHVKNRKLNDLIIKAFIFSYADTFFNKIRYIKTYFIKINFKKLNNGLKRTMELHFINSTICLMHEERDLTGYGQI